MNKGFTLPQTVFLIFSAGLIIGFCIGDGRGYFNGQRDALDGKFEYHWVTNRMVQIELEHNH